MAERGFGVPLRGFGECRELGEVILRIFAEGELLSKVLPEAAQEGVRQLQTRDVIQTVDAVLVPDTSLEKIDERNGNIAKELRRGEVYEASLQFRADRA